MKTDSAFFFNNLQDSITQYRVIMNGGVCGSDTSNTVSIQVGASLGGILLADDTVCTGNNQGILVLTGYRGGIIGWDTSTTGSTGFGPLGHTNDSLVYLDLTDTTTFRVRVQNPGCPEDTSSEATILVIPGTSAGVLTGGKDICSTTNMDSVILVGRQGTLLVWEFSTNGGASWDTLTGQSTDTFIFNNLTVTTLYRVIIDSSLDCPMDTSNIVTIQVGPSDAGVITGDTQLCAGTLADLFLNSFTGDVLLWEFSTDGGNIWIPVPSSDTSDIKFPVSLTTDFRAIVQSDTCTPDTSAIHRVDVDQPYTAGFNTPTTQLCYGIGSDTIRLAGVVDTIFDWEFRQDSIAGFTSLSNTTDFQTYDTLKITHHYRVFVKVGVCPVDTAQIALVVDTFTLAGSITGDDTICSGSSGTILLSGHIGNTFTWQSGSDGTIFGPAPGATNDTFYVYNNLTDTTYYRLVVASGGCPPDTTNSVLIVVKPVAVAGTLAGDTAYCQGPNGGTLLLTGYSGTIVGWEESVGGGAFTAVSPANTTDSLVYSNITTTTAYRVIVSLGDCPNDTSNTATVTILPAPIAAITADGPTSFCEGGSVNLTASGGPDYLWSNSDTSATINVTTSGTFSVLVTDTSSGCIDGDTIVVTVFPLPTVDAGSDVTITEGQTVQLNASGADTYEWTPKTDLSDGFIGDPDASPSLTITYTVTGTDINGCTGLDSLTITVLPGEDSVTEFSNLFTPNGDGHNDTWKIRNLANCNTCQVVIFNRYGQEVLQTDNYQDDWEGTWNGAKLPDGTYYYIVKTETSKIYKGAITIIRGN